MSRKFGADGAGGDAVHGASVSSRAAVAGPARRRRAKTDSLAAAGMRGQSWTKAIGAFSDRYAGGIANRQGVHPNQLGGRDVCVGIGKAKAGQIGAGEGRKIGDNVISLLAKTWK